VALFAEGHAGERLADLALRTAAAGARTIAVPAHVLDAASPVRQPSGVVALARRPPASLDGALERAPQFVLVLAAVQDPGNVGAAVRAAEACGATGVVATAGTADPFGWKALRGSMGSSFRLPVSAGAPAPDVVRALRARGLRLLATVPRGGTPLPDVDLTRAAAVLLGGEGGGLDASLLDSADERVSIPMQPRVESLNVAIAAALMAYEAARQRSAAGAPRARP